MTAYDRSGTTKLADGALTAVDSTIDPTTGTVKLRAEFANSDEMLFPNQFVNARLLIDTLKDATVIPTAAVQRGAARHLRLSRQAGQYRGRAEGDARAAATASASR